MKFYDSIMIRFVNLKGNTVDGRNPAPGRAYGTIRCDMCPRTPFSMLSSQALCAGAGFESFNFFALVTNFSYQC